MTSRPPRVEMILIAEITVANPRMRNPKIHKTITESIEQIGLKRPITVRRVQPGDGELPYALICGQGRLGILCITSFSAFPTQLNQQVTSANLSEIGVMQRFLRVL